MIKYSVVVPFHNEELNVGQLYQKITAAMDAVGAPYEMVFVEDGSTDRTFRILEEICAHDSRVTAVRLRRNFGQSPALKAGFDFARGEIVISMDGDLQHDPSEIPNFIAKIEEGFDIVSGWRVDRKDGWLTRRLPSRVANWIMAKLSRVDLHDFGTTFKAYRREVIEDIQLYGELHRFIPALASWAGATITEIPIVNIPRENGKSNYGLSRTFRVVLDLLSVKFLLDYSTKPMQFFGRFGLLGTAAGTMIGLFLLYKKLLLHESIMLQHGPALFMATLLILSGLQFLSIGLIGEILARTYFESQRKPVYTIREVRNLGEGVESPASQSSRVSAVSPQGSSDRA